MLRRRIGIYIFSGWLRRGDTSVSHAVGYNAGAGILYVGPYVVVVEEADRIQLDVFVARIEAEYGLYLSETCKSRQVRPSVDPDPENPYPNLNLHPTPNPNPSPQH